jgi:hypothetical protein
VGLFSNKRKEKRKEGRKNDDEKEESLPIVPTRVSTPENLRVHPFEWILRVRKGSNPAPHNSTDPNEQLEQTGKNHKPTCHLHVVKHHAPTYQHRPTSGFPSCAVNPTTRICGVEELNGPPPLEVVTLYSYLAETTGWQGVGRVEYVCLVTV